MPSGSPCAWKLSTLFGLPKPMCVRATISDGRRLIRARGGERRIHRTDVHPVDFLDVPPVGGEPRADILRECDVGGGGERDLIRVVEHDQPAEMQIAGERRRLGTHPLHHVAIAREDVGVVVDDLVPGSIERRSEPSLRHCEPHGVPESLAERTGGDFDAGRDAALRMAGRLAPPLPEMLQILDADVVAGEMEEAVQQRAAVTRGQHEPVAIAPLRIRGIVPHVSRPQHVRHWRRTHGQPGVPGVRALHCIDAERANGVDAQLVDLVS